MPKKENPSQLKNSLAFIKEVAKYFMDFLETDFHKRKNPKRCIKTRNNDNFLVGINLAKYPTFSKKVWELINNSFDEGTLNKISKGVYKTNLPKNLLDLIKLQVEKISSDKIDQLVVKISDEIEGAVTIEQEDFEKAFLLSIENASVLVKEELVLPFVDSIKKSVESLGIGDENDAFLMEEELSEIIVRIFENKTSEVLKSLFTKIEIDVAEQIKSVLNVEDVKKSISGFFENFRMGDLFGEIFEMDRNRAILDKQEFYIYFCDITFNKVKFPIFYTPFTLKRTNDVFQIQFDSQVYINKKAVEYVSQEFKKIEGGSGILKTISGSNYLYISTSGGFSRFFKQCT